MSVYRLSKVTVITISSDTLDWSRLQLNCIDLCGNISLIITVSFVTVFYQLNLGEVYEEQAFLSDLIFAEGYRLV